MASVDLVDETFVSAPIERVAAIVADESRWATWFPDLALTVFMDRGLKGIRWSITGALVGSMELWLEEFNDGVIVHYYLRAVPPTPLPDTPAGHRRAAKLRVAAAQRWKISAWELKDALEAGRRAGDPADSVPQPESTGTVGRSS